MSYFAFILALSFSSSDGCASELLGKISEAFFVLALLLGLILLTFLLGREQVLLALTRWFLVLDLLIVLLVVILDSVQVLIFAVLASLSGTFCVLNEPPETLILTDQPFVVSLGLSDLDAIPVVLLIELVLIVLDDLGVISEHGQFNILSLQLLIFLGQFSCASLQVCV